MENKLNQSAVSVGKKLKEAREKKSLTIEQVQKQSRIHSTVLIALENGRIGELLTDTYIRSFLKKYTQLLGLSTAEILKEYFPPRDTAASANIPFYENQLPRETKASPKALYITGIVVLGIAAILILFLIINKITASLKNARFAQRKPAAAAIAKKTKYAAKPVPKKKTAVKAKQESKELVPKSVPLRLTIKVKEPVLVRLKKDGVLIFDTILRKGLVENVTANEAIELDFSKPKALEFTLNGRPLVLQAKNNILGLEITRKGVRLK
ncbi:MAG: helix-turn-helix domain-containing protein [Candidatus Omnitrophica bacterium]|nr:helix-turn-helix domain-containing protein [Candidatus Omnitrophota bacterium]